MTRNSSECLRLTEGLRDWLSWVTEVTGLDRVTGQDFFFSCQLYFFLHSFSSSYFLPLFHCLISILLFPRASGWENTAAWVPISYSHTEWNLLSSGTNTLLWWRACYQITNYKQTKRMFESSAVICVITSCVVWFVVWCGYHVDGNLCHNRVS